MPYNRAVVPQADTRPIVAMPECFGAPPFPVGGCVYEDECGSSNVGEMNWRHDRSGHVFPSGYIPLMEYWKRGAFHG